MAETTGATPPPDEPSPVAEPELPKVVGVAVEVPSSGAHYRVIVHDYGRGWDLNDDGSLTIRDAQELGIAAFARHEWRHVSLVFEGDD